MTKHSFTALSPKVVALYGVRESILCVLGRATGVQVTDEFIAQLPQQLIVPSSHLQLFESIGEGELQLHVMQAVLLGISHTDTSCIPHVALFAAFCHFTCYKYRKAVESWAGQ